jgi:hypothetical protein
MAGFDVNSIYSNAIYYEFGAELSEECHTVAI